MLSQRFVFLRHFFYSYSTTPKLKLMLSKKEHARKRGILTEVQLCSNETLEYYTRQTSVSVFLCSVLTNTTDLTIVPHLIAIVKGNYG